MEHKFIIPTVSRDPFAVKGEHWRSWEPGYPFHDERDYFIVWEIARILKKKKVIRRTGSSNHQAKNTKVDGIQQIRKWIRPKESKSGGYSRFNARLFNNSKKYGYLVKKKDFVLFFEEMTGDAFDEDNFKDCLLGVNNLEFIKLKEADFKAKMDLYQAKIDNGGTEEEIKKWTELRDVADDKYHNYRVEWLKVQLAGKHDGILSEKLHHQQLEIELEELDD